MKYWQRRKQEKLYKQWAKHAELPPEAIPVSEAATYVQIHVEEESWFYRFRVSIWNAVGRILRVK